jgi:hypothetical protein
MMNEVINFACRRMGDQYALVACTRRRPGGFALEYYNTREEAEARAAELSLSDEGEGSISPYDNIYDV